MNKPRNTTGVVASTLLASTILTGCASQQTAQIIYPETKKVSVVDNYFGTEVADPYRWLEDDMSEETAAWVTAQNLVTNKFLDQIPYRDAIKARLTTLLDYEKVGMPFIEGDYTYFYKNDGLQNQSVLYRQKGEGEPEVFLDPNTFSADGTISLAGVFFTEDASKAVYTVSEGGSDWRKAFVIDVKTKEQLETPLVDLKFTGASWLGNEGFYYSTYDKPEGSELSAKTDQHKVYFHKLGTAQSEDKVIFGATPEQKNRYIGGYTSDDDRFLFISAAKSTTGNKFFIKDLSKTDSGFITITNDYDSDDYVVKTKDDTLYILTNRNAPNKRLVKVNAANPQPEHWVDVIPETKDVLSVTAAGNYLIAEYTKDAVSMVQQFDLEGNKVRDIALPEVGSAGGFSGKDWQTKVFYSFSNPKTPNTIFSYDLDSGKSEVHSRSKVDFNSEAYTSSQVFYSSKDGTRVPMIITHRKDIELDGSNPTILYGYGGFGVSLTPYFSTLVAGWLEMGGVYAVANLRGGGEYGKAWHDAGTKLQKQNVFDDFIAASEYLIENNYTSSSKLAIKGGSNGGLLVGAAMTQRPDLYAVALPAVGVMDMLRYHTFTAGAGWAYDYGTAEDSKEMFEYLLNYSPVHNVREGVDYPATLVTTGDHDDRVVPAHSHKFAAELQTKHKGPNPTLIRIETDAGHGAGTPLSKTIEEYADVYSFTLFNMGVKDISVK
ncbi:prolyl oligopeptidase family serine peptidase [Parendozoicomonas haliclonae]|uniref:prolyl oligopeptidase n=1 Tax=Parendozoicomonas haliclonae TaxID=1960125 RepID=A0A1X7AIU2_9GAMM|nr:prolyl oligopeptidase family serine peptidase [Parendozoicomonas haliclonae]SMA44241.1 Prolyl endopeptidase [Parendozoicomonas haliclonae]